MFARFDENPAMTLQNIKETKRYGRTDARTDARTHGCTHARTDVKTVYPPQTKFAGGIKIVKRYIRVGYNLDIMRQSACLVLNPITVYSYGFLFNCTTVGQTSDSMTALT